MSRCTAGMDRRTFLGMMGVAILAGPLVAEAPQAGKVPRVGVLLPGSREPEYERRLDLFRQGLRDGGYVEGQNVVVDYRWAETKPDRIPDLVAELIGLKVD